MNISLTKHFEEFVQQKLKSGQYHSASEVIRAALRLLEEQDKINSMRLEEIRNEIRKGDIGDPVSFDVEDINKRGRKFKEQRSK